VKSEKELKLSLTREEYEKMLGGCASAPVLQTNFYFVIDEKSMTRVRKTGDYYELTTKSKVGESDGVFLSREDNKQITQEEFYALGPCLGKLDTWRAKFDFSGFEIELDKNRYLFTTDYELEFECFDDVRIEELKTKVGGSKSETKAHRFSKRKKFLESKKYGCVLFDFDGTLCDTEAGIANSIIKTCAQFGLDVSSRNLKEFYGPPVTEIYTTLLGADKAAQARAIHRHIHYTESYLMHEIYQGITELLNTLKQKGIKIGVATARSEDSARQISDFHGIGGYLDFVFGLVDGARESKAEIIKAAVEASGVAKEKCLMVGDRFYDLEGAAQNGIDAVAVLYGYGTERETEGFPQIATVRSVAELGELLEIVT